MISILDSIPKRSSTSAQGEAMIWSQFNEVTFFVEDKDQERFYFHILKKLFINIKFEKIIGTGGKDPLKTLARKHQASPASVFIADLDFDDILNRKETIPNVFYLERYSIENYLINKNGLYEIIREHRPSIKERELRSLLASEQILFKDHAKLLRKLAASFLLIQQHALGIPYHRIDPAKEHSYPDPNRAGAYTNLESYFFSIETKLKSVNPRYRLNNRLKTAQKHFNKRNLLLKNCPGKYLVSVAKIKIENICRIPQSTNESFCYRLAKNSQFNELQSLKENINQYINSRS